MQTRVLLLPLGQSPQAGVRTTPAGKGKQLLDKLEVRIIQSTMAPLLFPKCFQIHIPENFLKGIFFPDANDIGQE